MIIIEGRKVWLRGMLARKVKTLKQLEAIKEKEAVRWEKGLDFMGKKAHPSDVNPRMGKAIRERPMLKWLHENGMIFRSEKIVEKKGKR